ncbi:Uncharacterized protein Fot_04074 [Forsythia ovata]|uniref:RNase H type-1 domain-containing protein n=1 Tax=Forsythia ovata TaxID=205694 RepID=A0ABD1XBI3_9LAMI
MDPGKLATCCRKLTAKVTHIRREANAVADSIANEEKSKENWGDRPCGGRGPGRGGGQTGRGGGHASSGRGRGSGALPVRANKTSRAGTSSGQDAGAGGCDRSSGSCGCLSNTTAATF